MEYTEAQDAPWKVGTKLRYIGDSQSGFRDEDGEAVWSHANGAIYTVIKNTDAWAGRDFIHGWSTLQSEFDPNEKHCQGIDVESMNDYRII